MRIWKIFVENWFLTTSRNWIVTRTNEKNCQVIQMAFSLLYRDKLELLIHLTRKNKPVSKRTTTLVPQSSSRNKAILFSVTSELALMISWSRHNLKLKRRLTTQSHQWPPVCIWVKICFTWSHSTTFTFWEISTRNARKWKCWG